MACALLEVRDHAAPTLTTAGLTVTPVSRAITLLTPWGGLVWSRPHTLLIHRGDHTEQVRLVDWTRRIQCGLLAVSVGVVLGVLYMRRRRRRR